VLVAICVTVSFLMLQLTLAPFATKVDNALATVMQLVLLIIYLSVLLIKICDLGKVPCAVFGFGDDGTGLFYFFVIFASSLLVLLLLLGAADMWFTRHVRLLRHAVVTH
jgi:hypothetical protein